MTNIARGIAGCVISLVILALASAATPSWAQTPAKSLKDKVVGHWDLVSITANDRTPYGPTPQGSMFLDAGGHFSMIVISTGNARSIAYFGTYTVSDADNAMTLHVLGNTGGAGFNAAGRDQKRIVSFSGDDMVLGNQTPAGLPGSLKLTWKLAN